MKSGRVLQRTGWSAAFRALVGLGLLLPTGTALARDAAAEALAGRHQALQAALAASPLGLPLLVQSHDERGQVQGEAHALLSPPFADLLARLRQPRAWCDVLLLHLNVKGCLHESAADGDRLTLYSGRKLYEPMSDASPLRLRWTLVAARADHLQVELTAADGPMGTGDYRITLAALPVEQGSFVHFRYAYRSSALSRLAVDTYLATLGRDKVGFTVLGTGSDGHPLFVGGQRGVVERNAVRYLLAVQADLEVERRGATSEQPFEQGLARWFELTERWPRQLHELDRDDYLAIKRRERAEQLRRQQTLDRAAGRP